MVKGIKLNDLYLERRLHLSRSGWKRSMSSRQGALKQEWGSGFGLENGYGALYLKRREIFKSEYFRKYLKPSFLFSYFWSQTYLPVLYSDNQPGSGSGKIRTGSGALCLTGDVWHQKYKNKKEGVQNYLSYSFNRLLNISLSLRYRSSDPVFGQNRILIPAEKTCYSTWVQSFWILFF